LTLIIAFLIFLVFVGIGGRQWVQYKSTIKELTLLEPKSITTFKIYPRAIRPLGGATEFRAFDPIIIDFFQSLTDIGFYQPKRDTVDSQDYRWFLEVGTKSVKIQINCYIPSKRGNIVVGELGEFRETSIANYGYFQSHLLYQWYQKYKDRWLQPTPSPQPTATPR
jgi:hypothetical protein